MSDDEDGPPAICPDKYPYCVDPEVANFPYELTESDIEGAQPVPEQKIDKNLGDVTWIRPEHRDKIKPPTVASVQEGLELLNEDCYADEDKRNAAIYDELLNDDIGPEGISISSREEWGAKPPKRRLPLKLPVQYVRFTYTGTKTDIFPLALEHLHELQRNHQDCGKVDVNYNFMVGKDGQVYEGRGFYMDTERSKFYDTFYEKLKSNCIDIAYMGEYKKDNPPTWVQLYNAIEVIRYCVETGVMVPNFKVIPMTLNPPPNPDDIF